MAKKSVRPTQKFFYEWHLDMLALHPLSLDNSNHDWV
jgi:hypothetical protein